MGQLFVFAEAQLAGRQASFADVLAGVVGRYIIVIKHQPTGVVAIRPAVAAGYGPVAKSCHLPARQPVVIDLSR